MNQSHSLPTPTQVLAAELQAAERNTAADDFAWPVPVELVLAAPAAGVVKDLVDKRVARGDVPLKTALAFFHGNRLYAQVYFKGEGRQGLLFPIDVWERV